MRPATIFDRRNGDNPRLRPRKAAGAVPSVPASGTPGSEAFRERVVAGQFSVRAGDLPPPRHAELLTQDVAVRLRRPWRDAEPLSNLFVGAAGRDQLDDLFLSWSQNGRPLLQHRRHGRDANNAVPAWLLPERRISRLTPLRSRRTVLRRPAGQAGGARTTPRAHARWPAAVGRARARRFAPAARTRHAGGSASSPARPSRW